MSATTTELLTIREAADRLRVSTWTIDKMLKLGKLRPLALASRVVRIPAAQVEALISDSLEAV